MKEHYSRKYDPKTRSRELAGRAVSYFCGAFDAIGLGNFGHAAQRFAIAEEDACFALAWHYQLVGDRPHVEAQVALLTGLDEKGAVP